VHCFYAGTEYAHGSLSLQECLVPEFRVRTKKTMAAATIESIKWVRMRCRISIKGAATDLKVDLRTKLANAGSSLVTPKSPEEDGTVSLAVEDEDAVGTAAFAVLLTADGQVIDKRSTTVGGEE